MSINNQENRINMRPLLLCMIVLLIASLIGGGIVFAEAGLLESDLAIVPAATAEQAIQIYIEKMKLRSAGSLDGEEKQIQAEVVAAFGESAWSAVTYKKIDGPVPYSNLVYTDRFTGQSISEEEAVRLNDTYALSICNKYDFNPEYLDYAGEDSYKLSGQDLLTKALIIDELSKSPRVIGRAEPACPYQYFQLAFDGKTVSDDRSTQDVTAIMVQLDGIWVCDQINSSPVLEPENEF